MILALTITHAIVSLALVIIVLLQQGKQQGLSGAIAGAGETFFGKSKARTIDAMLKKFTTVVAALFIINSIGLYLVIAANQAPIIWDEPEQEFTTEQQIIGQVDEDGNVFFLPMVMGAEGDDMILVEELSVDEDGNIVFENEDGELVVEEMLWIDEDGNIWTEVQVPVMPDMGFDIPIGEGGDLELTEEMMEELMRQMEAEGQIGEND